MAFEFGLQVGILGGSSDYSADVGAVLEDLSVCLDLTRGNRGPIAIIGPSNLACVVSHTVHGDTSVPPQKLLELQEHLQLFVLHSLLVVIGIHDLIDFSELLIIRYLYLILIFGVSND